MTAEAAARKEMMEHSATTNPDSHAAPVQPAMAPAFVEQSRISAGECKDFHESCDFRTKNAHHNSKHRQLQQTWSTYMAGILELTVWKEANPTARQNDMLPASKLCGGIT